MRKLTKAVGLLVLAASSVYSDRVLRAAGADPQGPAVGARPDGKQKTLRLAATRPATAPSTAPATVPATAPSTLPSGGDLDGVGREAASGVGSNVSVKDAGTVEIHVTDASLIEVLRMLSLQSQRNIIASKEVRGTVTADLFDVTVKEALATILQANGYDYREKGNFIFVYSAKELAEMEKAQVQRKTEIFRLYYTPAANAATMIKPVLSEGSQVSFTTPGKTGIASDTSDAGGNEHATEDVVVVTDFPERLEQVRAVLKEVDRRPVQILVEAVILRATLQENNDLGIDFTALGGVDFNALNAIGGGTGGSGLGQALSGQILTNPAAGGALDRGLVAGSVGGGGLKLGVVKNNIGLFISALEGVTDTVVMANPKVLVLNKQRGEVHVGSQQGYRTAVATETLTADDVKFLDTGTRLAFRPYVGDNGFVRLEIHPEDSSGSVNAAGLPNKFVTQVTSNVMVRDGHTIVIGGLFRESTDRTRSQVPGLGSLPGIGAAFRRQTDATVREEVIILLTPHIVKDEGAYSAASEEKLRDGERLRVGMRRGLMPWGRERMAESSYQKAVEEMAKPNPDRQKALWHLNCATNLNPKFIEAIELKSQVTGREATAVNGSSIRSFVKDRILADERSGATLPKEGPTTVPSASDIGGSQARAPWSATQPTAALEGGATTRPWAANRKQPATAPALAGVDLSTETAFPAPLSFEAK